MLEAVEGGLYLLEVEMLDVLCCVLLCMLGAMECGFGIEVSKFPLWPIFLVTVHHQKSLPNP
jgi:hypothetical protein